MAIMWQPTQSTSGFKPLQANLSPWPLQGFICSSAKAEKGLDAASLDTAQIPRYELQSSPSSQPQSDNTSYSFR